MNANKKMIYFGEPDLGPEEERAVIQVLRSKWVGLGNLSHVFEKELVDYLGVKAGVALSSCTAALHLSLIINKVKPGDEIITTPLTFAATANVILEVGAKPVFVDINPKTLNIDEKKIESAITSKTKGIIVVHFAGWPCELDYINSLARRRNLFVVEDAAHAFGSVYKGKMIGQSGNLTCFSFYANKNLTTVEGGLLSSDSCIKIERAKRLSLHGLSNDAWKRFSHKSIFINEVVELGYKYNITDFQSAVGLAQLKKFKKNQENRLTYAKLYDKILGDIDGISLQPRSNACDSLSAVHLYTIVVDDKKFKISRNEIVQKLRGKGIFSVVHYWPLHRHKLYRQLLKSRPSDFPEATRVGNNIFTLPLLPQLTMSDSKMIATITRETLLKYHR